MKPILYEIIKTTSGGFHSWVRSSVGLIRKPNNVLRGFGTENEVIKTKIENSPKTEITIKFKWYQMLWNWIKKFIKL